MVLSLLLVLSLGPLAARAAAQPGADSAVLQDFRERIARYVELHKQLEAKLPKLPKDATPEQITRNQDSLGAGIRAARAGAKRGDLFTPAMTRYVKRVLAQVFAGPAARQLRASIMDEYPGNVTLTVNGMYPAAVPVASMPPDVLARLPELPEELEYRFVGEQLILFDQHAHLIPDFILNAIPGSG